MPDALLSLVRDLVALVAVLVGPSTAPSALVLVGATTIAVLAVALLSRGLRTLVLGAASSQVSRLREALDVQPSVTQSDPDAPGRARPRAPALLLG